MISYILEQDILFTQLFYSVDYLFVIEPTQGLQQRGIFRRFRYILISWYPHNQVCEFTCIRSCAPGPSFRSLCWNMLTYSLGQEYVDQFWYCCQYPYLMYVLDIILYFELIAIQFTINYHTNAPLVLCWIGGMTFYPLCYVIRGDMVYTSPNVLKRAKTVSSHGVQCLSIV